MYSQAVLEQQADRHEIENMENHSQGQGWAVSVHWGQRSVRGDEKVLETGVEMAAQSRKDTSD